MKIKNFRDLNIWKPGKEISLDIYKATKSFPDEEKCGLISQIRRAAISIPSNVAEGFNRYHNKEYRNFLFVALGSCSELETQIEISHEFTLLSEDIRNKLLQNLEYESRMIRNLIKRLN